MSLSQHHAPLLVLGCHRSGTSAVTGLLHRATGVHLGETLAPTRDNPVGYFESPAVQVGHDLLLHALDRDWTCPPSRFDPEAAPREVLAEQVKRLAESAQPWAVKDPRMLFMLPAWIDLVDEFRFIGVIRSPAAIALSIKNRDKIPEEQAGRIAEIYVARLADLHRKLAFPIVDFSAPPSAVVDRVRSIASGLGLPWDGSEAATFLQPSLIRHHAPHQDPSPDFRYLEEEATAPVAEVPAFAPAEVAAALDNIPERSASAVPTNLGPHFRERRRRLWDRFTDADGIDRVIDLLPDGTPPWPIRPRDVEYSFTDYRSSRDLARRLARRPAASHIVAAGLLETTPPAELVRVLRDLSRYTQSFAEGAIDGFIADDDAETISWERGGFVTTLTGPLYHHTRADIEIAAAQTGWMCDFEQVNGQGRSTLTMSKDPDLVLSSLPDGGQTALLSIEARLAALERDIHRIEPTEAPATGNEDTSDRTAELERTQGELSAAATKLARVTDQYDRLRNRRIVRMALRLAAVFKPFFRLFRG